MNNIMMNITDLNYPYYSYIPSRYGAAVVSMIIYISLLIWFIQSFYVECRPRFLAILIFCSHLTTFIELILRSTLTIDILNTKILYKMTTLLLNISSRSLLIANYHCLVELRGKTPRRYFDRIIDIFVPISAIISSIILGFANELSFNFDYFQFSFRLRQMSSGLILFLSLLFYIVWYFGVSHARRLYVFPLLIVSSICVLIESIYIQILSRSSLFFKFNQNEIWFYGCHVIPITLALLTWSLFHPCRLLPPPEIDVQHGETGKELLSLPSSV